ncbi:MAG: hypothetical protein H7Z75_12400 [Ferruginibacter sp.]|nr:hypothetical protein [Cytophagales bacterium]
MKTYRSNNQINEEYRLFAVGGIPPARLNNQPSTESFSTAFGYGQAKDGAAVSRPEDCRVRIFSYFAGLKRGA